MVSHKSVIIAVGFSRHDANQVVVALIGFLHLCVESGRAVLCNEARTGAPHIGRSNLVSLPALERVSLRDKVSGCLTVFL